ncbi:MAG: hypothetical protein JWP92_3759 [Caulobacter sp.]|nr:hypothetical protein [Caulobacter sp.]
MTVLISLFLVAAVVMPSLGETVRRANLADQRRRQVRALLRDTPASIYIFED